VDVVDALFMVNGCGQADWGDLQLTTSWGDGFRTEVRKIETSALSQKSVKSKSDNTAEGVNCDARDLWTAPVRQYITLLSVLYLNL